MKKIILALGAFLIMSIAAHAQQYCIAYTIDRGPFTGPSILFISKIFDSGDFDGSKDTYTGIKFSIKDALKKNGKELFGTQAVYHQFEIVTKNRDGNWLTTAYDANLERKKLITRLTEGKAFKVIDFQVEPE
ncbi:MAG: hypothetical protein QM610_08065 [Chitinophagaceae bacterium]